MNVNHSSRHVLMFYLHKVLPIFLMPIVWVTVGVSLFIWLQWYVLAYLVLFTVYACSMPVTSISLMKKLERNYPHRMVKETCDTDAIVVLSGMVRTFQTSSGVWYELTQSSERIFAGIELVKEKSSYLILTRPVAPWHEKGYEGEYLAKIAKYLDVTSNRILLTAPVVNTETEAKAVADVLAEHNIGSYITLVTSAFHMPRAVRIFTTQGLKVEPYPVDFRYQDRKVTPMDFFPYAGALAMTSFFLREMIGRGYYQLRQVLH